MNQNSVRARKCSAINFLKLERLIENEAKAIAFAQENGLLPKFGKCPSCNSELNKLYVISSVTKSHDQYRFQCNKKKCKSRSKNQVSIKISDYIN